MSIVNFRRAEKGKYRVTYFSFRSEAVYANTPSLEYAVDISNILSIRWQTSYVYDDLGNIVHKGQSPTIN